MLEKLNQMAEQAATSVSRREFLGRFGRRALAVAAAAGGLLAIPSVGQAGRKSPRLCSANSSGNCQGLPEGSPCSQERASGRCIGTKPRGKNSTVTDCFCDAEAPR